MDSNHQIKDCRKQNTKEEKLSCKRLSLANTKEQWLKNFTYGRNQKEKER